MLLKRNYQAIDASLNSLVPVKIPYVDFDFEVKPSRRVSLKQLIP